jgi:predicted small lipoprotein YifL
LTIAAPLTFARRATFAKRAAALFLVAGFAFDVSGCGRRGPLEPPPNANAVQQPTDSATPEGHHKPPPITAPKTPFVLDPVL